MHPVIACSLLMIFCNENFVSRENGGVSVTGAFIQLQRVNSFSCKRSLTSTSFAFLSMPKPSEIVSGNFRLLIFSFNEKTGDFSDNKLLVSLTNSIISDRLMYVLKAVDQNFPSQASVNNWLKDVSGRQYIPRLERSSIPIVSLFTLRAVWWQ